MHSESIQLPARQEKYLPPTPPHAPKGSPGGVFLVEGKKTGKGVGFPRRIRTGGGWQFNWDRLGGLFLNMKRHTAVVTPDGRLALLATHWYRTPVAKLLFIYVTTYCAPDILTCNVRCSCVRQNADREKPAFWRTQLRLIAEISAIIMTQTDVLKTPFFRRISTSCQDVWRAQVRRHRRTCAAADS